MFRCLKGAKSEAPVHPVKAGQARRGFPERNDHFILCPFLPAGRQGPRLSRQSGTGHLPVSGENVPLGVVERRESISGMAGVTMVCLDSFQIEVI